MIIYLDQNKWIELAKIYHGKETSPGAVLFLKELEASIECGYQYPLSAIHYMEFSRISNVGRRKRLGEVMAKYSQGDTIVSSREIVLNEIENSLSQFYPKIKKRDIKLIGKGIDHAFGFSRQKGLPDWLMEMADEAILTGSEELNVEPISYFSTEHRLNFTSHLESLHKDKHELDKKKWDDWINAIAIADVIEPMSEVMKRNGLQPSDLGCLNAKNYSDFIACMPSRSVDVHLHKQVLKNPNYKPKISDLEDWAGLGIASSYCDVLVCEKHFADMLKRDSFKKKARVVTSLYDIFEGVA